MLQLLVVSRHTSFIRPEELSNKLPLAVKDLATPGFFFFSRKRNIISSGRATGPASLSISRLDDGLYGILRFFVNRLKNRSDGLSAARSSSYSVRFESLSLRRLGIDRNSFLGIERTLACSSLERLPVPIDQEKIILQFYEGQMEALRVSVQSLLSPPLAILSKSRASTSHLCMASGALSSKRSTSGKMPCQTAAACLHVNTRFDTTTRTALALDFQRDAAVASASISEMESGETSLLVASFYKFAELTDYAEMREPIRALCEVNLVSGGIILAPEGINGSICGMREAVYTVLKSLKSDPRLADMRHNEAVATPEEEALHNSGREGPPGSPPPQHGHAEGAPLSAGRDAPFRWDHVRVKLKRELVPLGMPNVDPSKKVGTYVKPAEWNALISDPDTVVIDVRNMYETRIGHFRNALDPKTRGFREFPAWVEGTLTPPKAQPPPFAAHSRVDASGGAPEEREGRGEEKGQDSTAARQQSPRKVAMYCTGGIRCEKATAYMLEKGFDEVYHLEGGILTYLKEVPPEESLWEGECFVFDKRVSVSHGLQQGTYHLCYACHKPVSDEDMRSPLWEEGVSCPYCHADKSEEEKERARARQQQFLRWGTVGGPDGGRNESQKQKKASAIAKSLLTSTLPSP